METNEHLILKEIHCDSYSSLVGRPCIRMTCFILVSYQFSENMCLSDILFIMKIENLIDKNLHQVFFLSCPAYLPFSRWSHPWIVINEKGRISRYEVRYYRNHQRSKLGYLHLDEIKPFSAITIFPFIPIRWKTTLLGYIQGDEQSLAKEMISFVQQSVNTYPYKNTYYLRGPNSNTYVQWVLNNFPSSKISLPNSALGKDYKDNKYQAIIFDYDGVIIDSFDYHLKRYQRMFPEAGLTAQELANAHNGNFLQESDQFIWSKIDLKKYDKTLWKDIKHQNLLAPGIKKLINKLDTKKYIVSSGPEYPLHNFLNKEGLEKCFSGIYGKETGTSKIEKFKKILHENNYSIDDIILITDTLGDIVEANKVGLKSIAVTYGFHSKKTLQQGNPFKIVDSVEELERYLLSC